MTTPNVPSSRPFTHQADCLCPTCCPVPRPDFLAIAVEVVTRADAHLALCANLLADASDLMAERTLAVMHRRLHRYQVIDLAWDFPDHFTITTSRDPATRDHRGARHLVTLLDVRDGHGQRVTTLDHRLHAGLITDGRAVTTLDHLRTNPTDPDSPISVARARDYFDVDQALRDLP